MTLVQVLRELQAADTEWDEKARLYQAARQRLSDQSELERARAEQHAREAQLATLRSTLRDAELEMASLQAHLKEIDTALYGGRVRVPKELEGMREDAEHLRKRLSNLEDKALGLMGEVDELTAESARGAEDLRAYEERCSAERSALTEQAKMLRARLQELQPLRERLRAQVGPAELALYADLRAKKAGQALSPLKDGVCQICRVSSPARKVQIVLAGDAVITCEGCGRILYGA
jgi:uncharacterized protein